MFKFNIKLYFRYIFFIISLILYLHFDGYFKFIFLFISLISLIYVDVLNLFKKKNIFYNGFLLHIVISIILIFFKKYSESILVITIYKLLVFINLFFYKKIKNNFLKKYNIKKQYVNIETDNGYKTIDVHNINIGDILIVKKDEKIFVDGIVIEGFSKIDISFFTGKYTPVKINVGDNVLSGSTNLLNKIKIQATSTFRNSIFSRLIYIIKNSYIKKSSIESYIIKLFKESIKNPFIIFIISILFYMLCKQQLYYKLLFFFVAFYSSLTLSIPLILFAIIFKLYQNGILIKDNKSFESLANVKHFIFDKTKILTYGDFDLVSINSFSNINSDDLFKLVAYAEYYSSHPIAISIKKKYNQIFNVQKIQNFNELKGLGISASVDGKNILVGNYKLMKTFKINAKNVDTDDTLIHIAINNKYIGYLIISDKLKKESISLIKNLNALNIDSISMFTGDTEQSAKNIATQLSIKNVYSELLPSDKFDIINEMIENDKKNIAFVCNNSAINKMSLSKVTVGITIGTENLIDDIDKSNIIIMNNNISNIFTIFVISNKIINFLIKSVHIDLIVKLLIIIFGIITNISISFFVFVNIFFIYFFSIVISSIMLKHKLKN